MGTSLERRIDALELVPVEVAASGDAPYPVTD